MLRQGKFNMKDMYEAMRDNNNRVSLEISVQKECFQAYGNSYCMVNICHGKLATKEILKRFNLINYSMCSFCNNAEENPSQLFFDCRHTLNIWEQILRWMDVNHK